jgi:hypothetical protein
MLDRPAAYRAQERVPKISVTPKIRLNFLFVVAVIAPAMQSRRCVADECRSAR